MDRRFSDAPHLRPLTAGGPAPQRMDEDEDPDGPSFLPPMRRRSRSGRKSRSGSRTAAKAAPAMPTPASAGTARRVEPVWPQAARSAPAAAMDPSGWMTDAEQRAAAMSPTAQAQWTGSFTRPGPLEMAGMPGFAGPPLRRAVPGRWLRPAFPWLAPRSLAVLAGLVLVGGLGGAMTALLGGAAVPAAATAATAPVGRLQLRHLIGQLEECRGIESLLVMLPSGAEREATLVRLQRQQKQIDTWLRDNGAWLTASHGAQAMADLREASLAWRALQQRVAQAEVVQGRTGLVRESRQLLTGPSAAAYRRVVQLVEGLAQRQPS